MFRKIFTLFSLILALLMVSCAPAGTPAPAKDAEPKAETKTEAAQPAASGEKVKLLIESWRNDDLAIWQDMIIPAFNKQHPEIEVVFAPSTPTEYNAALNAKLEGGTAGDLITCRPFDPSLALFTGGRLASLNDLPGMDNFSSVAKSAWVTDDGKDTFCVPMASVIHGFIYNADIFAELGLTAPKTESEFFAVLEKIKASGKYSALDMGTADQWEAATMGFQNIGPNYWEGEKGRLGLIAGTEKFTDPQYVKVFESLAKWQPYLVTGFEAQKYPDSQNLFTLGKAAIYPAGSWDISQFNKESKFKLGAFPPPVPDGASKCYISDHTDIAMGLNAKSPHAKEARVFLEWLTTAEFAEMYSNALPGFFSLSKHNIKLTDPVAQEFLNWRSTCESTIRNSYQILSRGEPSLENEIWSTSVQVIKGALTPADAGKQLQTGLDKWYKPAK